MAQKPTSNDNASAASPDSKTSTRSRSEIESALSGSHQSKRKPNSALSKALDLNEPPRRQQVIGGDLTGVTNRPRFGIFSRYSNLSIVNWVVCAIILLILAAFFWPQDNVSTQEVASQNVNLTPQLGETDLSVDEQSEFLESESNSSSLSFSRNDDLQRARGYREQERRDLEIRTLLDKAESQIGEGKYTQPSGENATETYKSILKISPQNIQAKQGLDFIESHFLESGYTALAQNNKAVVESTLQKLLIVEQGSDEYSELNTAYENWKIERRVLILLDNAETAFNEGALILPAKANALYFYQQALLLDKNNTKALDGVQKVADSYIQQANDAVLSGQYQAAAAHLATVSIIDPEHTSIALVEAMIARAKPLAEKALAAQRQIEELNRQRLEEASKDSLGDQQTNDLSTTTTSDTRTPKQQTSEQETFDRQYLKQGLDAYYKNDFETASALLQPLADKGIARAQFRIAYMHFLGRGFERSKSTAENIIQTALPAIQKFADDGLLWAQSDLGSLYEDGLVLTRNYSRAVYWYRSAAEKGYPRAQTNLGTMYARGRGVATSRRSAIEWFQRAAKQGDPAAQRNLETLGVN